MIIKIWAWSNWRELSCACLCLDLGWMLLNTCRHVQITLHTLNLNAPIAYIFMKLTKLTIHHSARPHCSDHLQSHGSASPCQQTQTSLSIWVSPREVAFLTTTSSVKRSYNTANILELSPPCVWMRTQLKIFCQQILVAPLKQFLQKVKQIQKVDHSLHHMYLVYPPQIQTVAQVLVSLDSVYHNELLFDGY